MIYTAKFHKDQKAQIKKIFKYFILYFTNVLYFIFYLLSIILFFIFWLLHRVFTSLMENRCLDILSIISCWDLKKRYIINKMGLSKWWPFICNFIMTSFWCQFHQYNISLYNTMSLTGTVFHNETEITVSQDIFNVRHTVMQSRSWPMRFHHGRGYPVWCYRNTV